MPKRSAKQHVPITPAQAFNLFVPYVKKRLGEQLRSVLLIILYLFFFQVAVLRVGVADASLIAIGLALVVFGLTFFIEGLVLGIMPLGEAIGVKLPQKAPIAAVLVFAFILGIGATLAEPTIGVLRAAGQSVKPWDAPLLYLLLNRHPSYLVVSVGVGVGVAVLFGTLRFLYNWSLKPFLFPLVLGLLLFSLWAVFDPNMRAITGVAWDCGGITTGPVTVPLVLALGIGICRVAGSASAGTAGLGVVSLASLFPILSVMVLGLPFTNVLPAPMSDEEFARPASREKTRLLFESEERLTGYVLKNGSPAARAALFDNERSAMAACLDRLVADGDYRENVLGPEWSAATAAEFAKNVLAAKAFTAGQEGGPGGSGPSPVFAAIMSNTKLAMRAIIPLCLFLAIVLLALLREKPARADEIAAGILFALIGLGLFNVGMEFGLARLGQQVGNLLPSTFTTVEIVGESRVIRNFDTNLVNTAIEPDGGKVRFFNAWLDRRAQLLPYTRDRFDPATGEYRYTPRRGSIDGKENSLWGFLVLFLFALVMGYGATLAEPALTALGYKVEEMTVGIFKAWLLKQAAAAGVGLGMAMGLVKILWDVPLTYLLIPPYLLALVLTFFSDDEFACIAWDSGGVTTGPVTVPLVLAMGLGVGAQLHVAEGFGIIALASVWPILTVLTVGMAKTYERRTAVQELSNENTNGAGV